ncbi:FERM domain-containing protein 8 [Ctenocephalides felis]|uniref:FERM domain-containing protein 8 n=1 Tax=Ctenocephalides felis TaxID=7515 RepID=UPI000E6E1BD8|nr:FERM domain-containing protein 8 [Ctenocephalides felis]
MIPTCIYLMSRVAIRLEVEDTASCPARVMAAAALHADDLGVANRALAAAVFCLWMTSPLLEVQLKPLHRPFEVRRAWSILLERFGHGTANQHARDEPIISLQRNVFFPKQNEDKIKDPKIIELLYEEARHNVLGGRYPCEPSHCIMLGGIQARIELGPYNPQAHTTSFFREKQGRFLPAHVRKSESWAWLPISSKHSAEVRLLEQFKRVPNAATTRKLMRKYLEFCWALPFYGAAFFQGQVEQPVRGLTSLITHQDIPVLVAINQQGIYIIDDLECTLLLGLRYPELSWDFAKPSREELPECLPCLFLQFAVLENGARVYKVLQIFSKQASMMDVLISSFIEEMKKARANGTIDEPDRATINFENNDTDAGTESSQGPSCLSNKLSRLTLATFDEEGRCIGQMGSFSFSY